MTGAVVLFPLMSHRLAQRRLALWRQLLPEIDRREAECATWDDQRLRKQSLSLRWRARSGEPPADLLTEAFALVRDAARRTIGMRHYDVQLLGGIAIHHGSVAEMQTGEGKTLTATLPMYLAALAGNGAHLATANDYLARRDAELMRPVYEALGMTVGVVEADTPRPQRGQAYQCDVTYGTAKEFGFDFLRDRLLLRSIGLGDSGLLADMLGHDRGQSGDEPVQRELNFALIDEADAILIDEARTPLIVSSLPGTSQEATVSSYRWGASVAEKFEQQTHYQYNHQQRSVLLNAAGRRLARELPQPDPLAEVPMTDLYEYVERAIKVQREYLLDRHYVIRDGEIVIVDEFTGRLAEGRKWRDGIHQAVEARAEVDISVDTGQAARVTVQDFFLRYEALGGMTGTAANSEGELKKIYNLRVVSVPTNRPPRRLRMPDRVLPTSPARWNAIVEEVAELHASGRPVLVGTRSIDKSEILSALLKEAGVEHQVLNARHIAAEAELVAAAGQHGKVTVATNMAGRGTDIQLGESVQSLGGIHVICSELHESARIDRQLIGRCGRQGDPGSFRQYLALDDEILSAGFGPRKAARLEQLGQRCGGPLDRLAGVFRAAQRRVESKHYRQRRLLMYHEKERRKMQLQMGQDPYLDSPS